MESNRESLEERLARIKLKNAEIEKKHREAEADRIKAVKDNAMVEIKSPKHPPKQHKYDHVDFVYNDDAQENAAAGGSAPATASSARKGGPPPDPAYNFLADSTRDGTTSKAGRTIEPPPTHHQQFRKERESFRRNQSKTNFEGEGGSNWNKSAKPAKNLETNWRNPDQEIDRNKTASYTTNAKEGSSNTGTAGRKLTGPSSAVTTPTPISPTTPTPPKVITTIDTKLPERKEPELVVEQRGNIQISVSKDGEIQSVKLTANRSAQPGTGRVGLPRAITKQQVAGPSAPIMYSTPPPTLLDQPPPPLPIFNHQPVVVIPTNSLPIDSKKFSVQDRLAKFQVALGSTNP